MKKILIIAVLLLACVSLQAQNGKESVKHKQIEAQKVTFITQSLDLSPKEAQQFWPLYNEMKKKQHAIIYSMRKTYKSCRVKNHKKCSDSEILAKCDSVFMCEKQLLDNKIEYFNKFKKVLPAKKVHRLLNIEKDFNKKLIKRLGRHRGQGQRKC